ncbi:hypothetical protein STEG23_031381 [Scotinomys teguina]
MAKATKKSQDPNKKTKPSASVTKSKKARTAGKKDGKSSSRRCRTAIRSKVQMVTKVKETRPRSPKRKASKKITFTKKTKKANEKSPYGHYHGRMDAMTSPKTGPGQLRRLQYLHK